MGVQKSEDSEMSKSRYLLEQHTVSELFTVVYVLVDDYLKTGVQQDRFTLPRSEQQKGSYSELMTIALVGDLLNQADVGLWFNLVKREYEGLFPVLPDDTRYYRVLKNLERIWADFALMLGAQREVVAYSIDSKPLPVCKFKRHHRPRAMTEATVGFSTQGAVYGFKLHALTTTQGLIVKFAVVPAHEADVTVARALLDESERGLTLGDKAYQGGGIYTPPKTNALNPGVWTRLMDAARKTIESVFSSLTRTKFLVFGQRNSFQSLRAHVCRKIAAHNFACVFAA
jgi:transposase